jgi:hypothetical protein
MASSWMKQAVINLELFMTNSLQIPESQGAEIDWESDTQAVLPTLDFSTYREEEQIPYIERHVPTFGELKERI